jgi:glycosyltransferase involved in cell wall biosynthesis
MLYVLFFNIKCFAITIEIHALKKIDVCISRSIHAIPTVYMISRLFRIPWIYDVGGIVEVEMRELKVIKTHFIPLLLSLERLACRCANKVLVVSEHMKEVFIRLRAIEYSKVIVSEGGVDLSLFNPKLPMGSIRARYDIPMRTPLILFVGVLSPREGVDRLIKAMRYVVRKYPDAKLFIVGGGSIMVDVSSQLKKLVSEEGLEKNVVFVGRVRHEEVPYFIIDSDVCVAPFTSGFSPIKVYEYLACGKPVIVTSGTDIGDLLVQRNAGLAVNTAKPDELASAVLNLLEDISLAQTLSKNGFDLVKHNFALEVIAQKLMSIIKEL